MLATTVWEARGQQLSSDSVLSVLANQYPVKRVYLHFDKEKYSAGDPMRMW